jgi:hypothetical protein
VLVRADQQLEGRRIPATQACDEGLLIGWRGVEELVEFGASRDEFVV